MTFLKNDSVMVIKSIGSVPDGLTKELALDSGYLKIDTTFVLANMSIYNKNYLAQRKVPFNLDSLPYVPFSREKFSVEAGS